MTKISRRSLLKGVGTATISVAAGACERRGDESAATAPYLFFTPDEARFVEAATARLIPADESGPGALEAGVASYIDKQLAGAWGAGEQLYRSGPWTPAAAPEMGYQLPFTPAELFRKALRALHDERGGFATLTPDQQDQFLAALEKDDRDLGGVPSKTFFASLLEMTIEGFFSDPVHGGNKGMVGWTLIGFPGAYASYYDLVDKHGVKITRPPISLAEDRNGIIHLQPAPATRS